MRNYITVYKNTTRAKSVLLMFFIQITVTVIFPAGVRCILKILIGIYIKIDHGHFQLKHPFLPVDIFLYYNNEMFLLQSMKHRPKYKSFKDNCTWYQQSCCDLRLTCMTNFLNASCFTSYRSTNCSNCGSNQQGSWTTRLTE